ncbi:hypothetical protein CR513_53565, partial [Mucuna pruriens]
MGADGRFTPICVLHVVRRPDLEERERKSARRRGRVMLRALVVSSFEEVYLMPNVKQSPMMFVKCIIGFGLTKFMDVNIDIQYFTTLDSFKDVCGLAINVMDSCLA